jgi:hypothetical protein
VTHDYTEGRRGWGHDFFIRGARWTGWGDGIGVGDQIAVTMESGRVGLYRVDQIEYCSDPRDMWRAAVTWLGYASADAEGGCGDG